MGRGGGGGLWVVGPIRIYTYSLLVLRKKTERGQLQVDLPVLHPLPETYENSSVDCEPVLVGVGA